jgi:hypothetical protein
MILCVFTIYTKEAWFLSRESFQYGLVNMSILYCLYSLKFVFYKKSTY